MKKLYGTGVALITPFTDDEKIDYQGLKRLLRHTAKGVDYYVVMGTTGESATLAADERQGVLDFVRNNNSKGLPIVYGIGGNNTRQVIESIKSSDLTGVVALLSVSPYYNKPSQEGIFQHFKAIADVSPIPVILYNVPGRTASNISADTTLRLSAHKNIIGVKEASGNLEQCMRIAREKPKDFMIISGDDMFTVALYSMGAAGVISVLANAYPVIFKRIRQYALAKEFGKANAEIFKLLDMNPLMYEESNPVGLKALLEHIGICTRTVRLPLAPASEALRKKINSAMVEKK